MKTYWRSELQLHAFLTSALDGGEWSASRPGRFTPTERATVTHWIRGWVSTRACLDETKLKTSNMYYEVFSSWTDEGTGNCN
jgi:hypothetical protein